MLIAINAAGYWRLAAGWFLPVANRQLQIERYQPLELKDIVEPKNIINTGN